MTVFAQGAPSEVTEQPVMAAIPLSMTEWMELLIALVTPTMVGMVQLVMTPPSQVEVAAVIGKS